MANAENGNTIYIDSTGDITDTRGILVKAASLTATAANAVCLLRDQDSANSNKIDLRNPTSGSTAQFDFSDSPLQFPNGIDVQTLSNGVITLVVVRK